MKNIKSYFLHFAIGAFLFLGLLSLGLIKLRTVYGQTSQNISAPQNVSSNVETIRERIVVDKTALVSPAIMPMAPAENVRLRDSLSWTFGGKSQLGWYLYVPLIQQTLKNSADANSPEFARAIAAWQLKSGITPTGIYDEETLLKMVAGWQANRLNSSQYPSDDALISAPITDFYDPTRDIELLKVERETYAAYKRMVAAAAKDLHLQTTGTGELAPDEKFLKIVSAFRSREYQEKLRAASPNSGRAGLAVNSPHFTGHALDLYVGGEPVTTKDFNRAIQVQTPAYKWLVKNASRFGFYPYYYEPWHWEYVPGNN